ncbi:hypothetical protein PhCBS80983_g02732 [Powellomyces hirtus]|uniref:HSF-type DNA-binding domain-containing protein n=1 Tax=Powellomyces hirtus TaxID=109895 RepID=A0A507E4U7_9FUNG|nr:hypothetical protein PhCBS80983_g02732 [Powellomyces hirtus]
MVQKTTFIQKLHRILEDDAYKHLIRWSPSGTSFLVLDSVALSSQILPLVFKHNNYTSFVRQLNLYGFHKKNRSYHRNVISDGSPEDKDTSSQQHEPREFSHPKFLRFRPDLVCDIRRKPTAAQQQQMLQQRKEGSTLSQTDSESYNERGPSCKPALHLRPGSPSGTMHSNRSPISPIPTYNGYSNMNRDQRPHDAIRGPHDNQALLSSRSSFESTSSTQCQPAPAPQMQIMQDMQATMMKQISYLQETVHHLAQEVREMRDKNDMLERDVDMMAGGRQRKRSDVPPPRDERRPIEDRGRPMDDRSRPIDDRRPMSPLPFSSRHSRPSPPVLPQPASSAITLPPPSALASFNPTPYASPPVDGERIGGERMSSERKGSERMTNERGERYHPYRGDRIDESRMQLPPLRGTDEWKQQPVAGGNNDDWERNRGPWRLNL